MKLCISSIFVLVLLSKAPLHLHAQPDTSLFNTIESFLELSEDESESRADLLEQIEYLHLNPINLNKASETEIVALPLIPQQHLLAIIQYRKDKKQFKDWQELYSLIGYDVNMLRLLQYLSFIGDPQLKEVGLNPYSEQKVHLSLYGGRRYPKSSGYSNSNPQYLGSPWRYASRVQYQRGQKIYAGVSFEKDAGEIALRKKHPQFLSGFLELRSINTLIQKVIVGDYQFISGQGLSNGNSFALGRSLNMESSYQGLSGIKAHTSTNEWHYHRGFAVELVKGKFHYQAGFSHKPSQLNQDNNLAPNISGYYRSEQEISKYKQGLVKSLMHYAYYQNSKIKLGAGISNHEKSLNINKLKSQSLSVDASLYLNRGIVFTEISHGTHEESVGNNIILGATLALSNQLQLSTVFRHFQNKALGPYHSIKFQKAADEERGGLIQLRYLLTKNSSISFLYDKYTSLNLDAPYRMRVPNHDVTLQYALKKRREYLFYLRARFRELQSYGFSPESLNEKLIRTKSLQFRVHIDKSIHEHLQFSARVELKNLDGINDIGMLLYQQINWILSDRFTVIIRASWFRIENYELRIYAYEPQVPSIYSLPSHYGQGQKTLVKLKMQLGSGMSVWLRLSQSYYYDRTTFSTGLNELPSNTLTDFHFCLRKNF